MAKEATTVLENSRVSFDAMEEMTGGLPDAPENYREGADGDDDETEEVVGKKDKFADDVEEDGKPKPELHNDAAAELAAKIAKIPGKDAQKPKEQEGDKGKAAAAGEKGAEGAKALPKSPYRASFEGKDLDIQPGAMVKTKVDGKEVEVSVHDLVTGYAGKVAYDRKFQEVATERKAVETEKATHHREKQSFIDTVNQASALATEKKDPRGMVYLIAEKMGADPLATWKGVVTQVAEVLKANGVAVDDAQLETQFKDDELAYYKGRDERKASEAEANKGRQVLETRMSKVQEKFNNEAGESSLTKVKVVQIYDRIVKAGKTPKEDITPELVGEIHEIDCAYDLSEKVVAQLEIPEENKGAMLDLVADTKLKNPDFTEEQLIRITQAALGAETSKVAKVLQKKTAQRDPQRAKPVESGDDPMNFDEMDD